MKNTRSPLKTFFAAIATISSLFSISTGCEGGGSDGGSGGGDHASFNKFNWTFGGVNGSNAAQTGVKISNLSFSDSGLSFKYDADLSAWGMAHGDSNAYACLFVKKSDGSWVGGKFDWISSSRTTRSFAGHVPGYSGWTLADVPNPCEAAFVIVDGGRTRRSNVVSGTWQR
jgi:hypothetical protein